MHRVLEQPVLLSAALAESRLISVNLTVGATPARHLFPRRGVVRPAGLQEGALRVAGAVDGEREVEALAEALARHKHAVPLLKHDFFAAEQPDGLRTVLAEADGRAGR